MIVDALSLFELDKYSANPQAEIDSDQRYTPKVELERVVKCLGAIGLDPCANPQNTVPALYHITERENCLVTDWTQYLQLCPTVFMNPPYSNSAPFINRLAQYVRSNHIRNAITLTLSGVLQNISTQAIVRELAVAACAPTGRINFIGGGGSNDRDVIWILWGCDADINRFAKCFDGLIMEIKK